MNYALTRSPYSLAKLLDFILHEYFSFYSVPLPSLKFTNLEMRALSGGDELSEFDVTFINHLLFDSYLILLRHEDYWILAPCYAKEPISVPPGLLMNLRAGHADMYLKEMFPGHPHFADEENEEADDPEESEAA